MCDFLQEDNTTLVWDNEQQVPFAYRDDQWLGFDDERSLKTKVIVPKLFGFGLADFLQIYFLIFKGRLVEGKRIRWSDDLVIGYGRLPGPLRLRPLPAA